MHVRAFLLLLSLPVISDPRLTYIVYLSAACPTTSSPFRILILCHLPRPKPVPGYWMLAASPRPPAWFYARLSLSSSWVTFYLTFLLNKLCCIWICLCPLIYYNYSNEKSFFIFSNPFLCLLELFIYFITVFMYYFHYCSLFCLVFLFSLLFIIARQHGELLNSLAIASKLQLALTNSALLLFAIPSYFTFRGYFLPSV